MKKFTLLVLIGSLSTMLHAQPIGGEDIYEFITLSPSARTTALGGTIISVADDDVVLGLMNPATLNKQMHNQLSFNHNFFVAGINNGYAAYGYHADKIATTFHGGVQYLNYGTFDRTDEFGQLQGAFNASEYALNLGAARRLYDKLSVGANLKMITSQLEDYNSFGLAADVGAYYQDTSGLLTIGLVLKNMGTQVTTFADQRESIPFDLQIGISRRLRYLPFRISAVYHNLHRWNVTFDDPNSVETTFLFGDLEQQTENRFGVIVDNFFRHIIFSGEFLLGKAENLRLRFAYNHFQRKELSVENLRSLAGFSMGLGFKIKRFRIEYGRAFYHLAGGMNHFSISTNINEFKKGLRE